MNNYLLQITQAFIIIFISFLVFILRKLFINTNGNIGAHAPVCLHFYIFIINISKIILLLQQ